MTHLQAFFAWALIIWLLREKVRVLRLRAVVPDNIVLRRDLPVEPHKIGCLESHRVGNKLHARMACVKLAISEGRINGLG